MKLKSSQGWAIGAIALTILIACSPPTPPAEPPIPTPKPPTVSEAAPVPATPASASTSTETAQPLGYAGEWAAAEADCGNAAKTFQLSADHIDVTPDGQSCAVKSISSQTPTGRSMIYTVAATCPAGAQTRDDTFQLKFGASDTFMQLQQNDKAPVGLVRCPAVQP